MVNRIYKIRSEIWVAPSPRNLAARNIRISARFRTASRLDRDCLRNATRHRESENGVANYGHSRTGELNSVYFGPQTAKNIGPEFGPTQRAAIRLGITTHLVTYEFQRGNYGCVCV